MMKDTDQVAAYETWTARFVWVLIYVRETVVLCSRNFEYRKEYYIYAMQA